VVAGLRRQLAERDVVIVELRAENDELRKQLAVVLKRLEVVEEKLRKNSANSSKPPSSDPPDMPKPKRKRSKRRPGGQPGHKGKNRKLIPADEVDAIKDHRPSACRACGLRLEGDDPCPQRHQVTDLPPILPVVVEHRRHALTCTGCGVETRAELPQGIPAGCFGPRLQAMLALFTGCYRLSKRNVEQIMQDCFGVELSLGTVKALESATSEALAAPFDEAAEHVKIQASVGMDETSWPHGKKRAWLWVAVAPLVTLFVIRASRGSVVAKEMIGEVFRGVVCSDRWSGYSWLSVWRRQVCWAHLKRDFQKIAEMGGTAKPIGEGLLIVLSDVFKKWHRVRDGTLKRSSFRTNLSPLRAQVRDLLRQGTLCEVAKAAGMCKQILKLETALWTFARVPGVEPTNNASERALRPAVIWRKTSFGTKSDAGREFVERMLTVVGSLRRQNRNVLHYLTEACQARLEGGAAPSLLSAPANDGESQNHLRAAA